MGKPPPKSKRKALNLCLMCGKEPLLKDASGAFVGSYGEECRKYFKDYGKVYRAEHGIKGDKNRCTRCRKTGHTRRDCKETDFVQVKG